MRMGGRPGAPRALAVPTGPLGSAGPPQTAANIFSCILERLTENWLGHQPHSLLRTPSSRLYSHTQSHSHKESTLASDRSQGALALELEESRCVAETESECCRGCPPRTTRPFTYQTAKHGSEGAVIIVPSRCALPPAHSSAQPSLQR